MSPRRRAVFLCHHDRHLFQFRLRVMKAVAARGWEAVALCPPGGWSGRFAAEGIRHEPYGLDRGSLNPFKEASVVADLTRILRRLRPDLLCTYAMKPNIYGALAAAAVGARPLVATVSGLGSFYTGEPGPLRRLLDPLYALAMRRADRVIFENEDDRGELLRLGVVRPGQCRLVRGAGVDPRSFSPAARPAGPGPVVVTMAARLIRDKGVGEYLAAAEALKGKWGAAVVFQLAGEEDPGNPWAADIARIEACAARGVVRRLGFIADVPALMKGTDVYVLPSYREGTPVSVLEAMSCGLAVVTTDAVGCRETVVPETSGLRVPVADVAALTAAIDRLIGDPGLRRRLGEGARRRVLEVFSDERIVPATLAVYREVLPAGALSE